MSKALDKIKKYKRDILRELLSQCTKEQQKFFNKMYLNGIENIPENKVDWAIRQCENTIKKNGKNVNVKFTRFEIIDI